MSVCVCVAERRRPVYVRVSCTYPRSSPYPDVVPTWLGVCMRVCDGSGGDGGGGVSGLVTVWCGVV